MNQKVVGAVLIIAGIILTIFVFMAKAKEDAYIQNYIAETGSCYLESGTCLHDDRDWSLYIAGWILSAALALLGIYLLVFDRTNELMLRHQERIAGDLKSANESKAWVSILKDTGNGDRKEADWILKELEEYSKIFASSILTLKGKK